MGINIEKDTIKREEKVILCFVWHCTHEIGLYEISSDLKI